MTETHDFLLTVWWEGIEEFDLLCRFEWWPGIPESDIDYAVPGEVQCVEVVGVERYVFRRWCKEGPVLYSTEDGPWMGDHVLMRWKQVEREFEAALEEAAWTFLCQREVEGVGPRPVVSAWDRWATDMEEDGEDWDEDDV